MPSGPHSARATAALSRSVATGGGKYCAPSSGRSVRSTNSAPVEPEDAARGTRSTQLASRGSAPRYL